MGIPISAEGSADARGVAGRPLACVPAAGLGLPPAAARERALLRRGAATGGVRRAGESMRQRRDAWTTRI